MGWIYILQKRTHPQDQTTIFYLLLSQLHIEKHQIHIIKTPTSILSIGFLKIEISDHSSSIQCSRADAGVHNQGVPW